LGLFHNEILNEVKAIEVFEELPLLRDLSIDGNPVSVKVNFKYELILRFKQLEILDEEPIQDLDRDVADQFFLQNRSNLIASNPI
jgi:Leucine-rich repeat